MNIFFWNIRGIANNPSREILFNFFKQFSPDVICLAEPMMNFDDFSQNFLISINMKMLTFNLRNGISKIWIWVRKDIQTPLIFSNSEQEITLDFGNSVQPFRVSFIHASVNVNLRRLLGINYPLLPLIISHGCL